MCLALFCFMDRYDMLFWDERCMLYVQMYASVCMSQDISIEHVFNKVKM